MILISERCDMSHINLKSNEWHACTIILKKGSACAAAKFSKGMA